MNMPPEDSDDDEGDSTTGSNPQEGVGARQGGRFSGDVFGGAVKARAFGDLNGQQVEQPTEVLLLPLLAGDDQQVRWGMRRCGFCSIERS